MTEYCRLCAELKDPSEIVASINEIEQSIEQKLRACCEWTTENTEQRLPHSVCMICFDKLDKCWLFSQSVQLAQQKLLKVFENEFEARTKHPPPSFKFQRSLHDRCGKQSKNKCEICLHEFNSAVVLNAHRQQGCEGLIEVASHLLDAKPTVVDYNCAFHMENDGPNMIPNDVNANNEEQTHLDHFLPKSRRTATNKIARKKRKSAKVPVATVTAATKPAKSLAKLTHKCNECGRIFSKKSNLNRHRSIHTGERLFECWMCHTSFRLKHIMIDHLMTHTFTSKERIQISLASKLKRVEQIQKNRMAQHKCDVCGHVFSKKSNLTRHHRTHSSERPYECEECGARFKEKYYIPIHRLTCHSDEHRFECWLCHRTFKLKDLLKKHFVIHMLSIKKRYEIYDAKKKAKFIEANGSEPIDVKQLQYSCDECGRSFRHKTRLREHRLMHTNKRPFECWLCHQMYKSTRLLKYHIKTHLHRKIYKENHICEQCGKLFTTAQFLSVHMVTAHSHQRPHKCDTCGLGFKTKKILKAHSVTHTEYEFKCTQCEKMFRHKRSLEKHMEYHTGSIVKPYICDICDKAFRRNPDLVEHRRIHTGEKPYSCEHCASNFRARSNFRTMSSFYCHLRKIHGISKSARNREEQMRATCLTTLERKPQ